MSSVKQKYRKVSTHIWNDQKFRALSERAKLAFLFIITHPHMTPLGAIRANIPGLAFELGMNSEAFTEAFVEVLEQGMAQHDAKGLLIWFPNFLKHNPPESPNVVRSWVGGYNDLPECDLKTTLIRHAACTVDGLSQGFREAFFEAFGQVCPQPSLNQEQEQEQDLREGTNVPLSAGADEGVSLPEQAEPVLLEHEEAKAPDLCQQVVDLYNRLLVEEQPQGRKLPECTKLSDKRRRAIVARRKDLPTLQAWEEFFRRVSRCPWLMGEGSQWRAAFDWLLNVSNFLKVWEGNFLPDTEKKAAKGLPHLSRAVDFVARHVAAGEDAAAMVALYCQHNRLDAAEYEPAVLAAVRA